MADITVYSIRMMLRCIINTEVMLVFDSRSLLITEVNPEQTTRTT